MSLASQLELKEIVITKKAILSSCVGVAFCLKFTDSSGEDIATGGVRGWWRCRAAVENDETKLMLCDVIFILLLLGSELRIVRSEQ